MDQYFEFLIAKFPPAIFCNKKGVSFEPSRLGIPFKWELFSIVKIKDNQIYPGTKVYNEYTTYVDGKPVLNVYDEILKLYKTIAKT